MPDKRQVQLKTDRQQKMGSTKHERLQGLGVGHCGEVGHLARECPDPKCNHCKGIHLILKSKLKIVHYM
jgi:hypothetical protein